MFDQYTISKVDLWPIDIPLTDPFVVATGSRMLAENVFVRVTLAGGAHGYGEMAPFPEVGGENRASCLAAATGLAKAALGQPATHYRRLSRVFMDTAPSHPAARCGLETALLDALCRQSSISLWALWGGADMRDRETDITIPITGVHQALVLAQGWYARGFRLFKLKVGPDVEQDIERLEALHRVLTDIAFIVDANQGFSREACLHFAKEAGRAGARIVALEQPVAREDLDGMAALRRDTGIPIAADESCRSIDDIKDLVRAEAADVVNIKIMKSGLMQAIDMAAFARTCGLRLMVGGMVESRLAMGCSFALALGMGGYELLDLDTPLLLAADPVQGGYEYAGPRLRPWSGAGLGLEAEVGALHAITIA